MADMYTRTNLAKEYNTHSPILNSIIAKLANLDEILQNLRNTMKEEEKSMKDTQTKKDELDIAITSELEKIKHSLYDKLNRMLDDLKNHQNNQRAEGLKLQQDISILKKEKLDLYTKVTDLQRRIADMEICIGQDIVGK